VRRKYIKKIEYLCGRPYNKGKERVHFDMEAQIDQKTDVLTAFIESDSDAPEQAARFLKSLAHRDRLRVLCGLLEGELTVGQIEAQVGVSQSATSQHLARLKDEGILKARREGRQIFYSITDPTVRGLVEILYQKFCPPE